jgi:DNA-directed RNA polymerase subunit RPC12/RpoP
MDAVDGNAIGGLLIDVFGTEMTAASSICATCGASRPVAELVVYRRAPGTIVRCRTCGSVLMVLVRRTGVTSVDLSGLASLSQPGSALSRQAGFRDRPACRTSAQIRNADKGKGRDEHATRRVDVDVGRAAGRVHVDGPAGPGVHVMAG